LLTIDQHVFCLETQLRDAPMDFALVSALITFELQRREADQNWLSRGDGNPQQFRYSSARGEAPEKKQPGAFKRKAKKTVSVWQAASL
jgi:hypothetical protein